MKLARDIDHNKYITISLHLKSINPEEKSEIAFQLHSKFAHEPANKSTKLLNSAGLGENSRLVSEVCRVYQACEICAQVTCVQARQASESVLTPECNDDVTVTLLNFGGQQILHFMDLTSRFIATCALDSVGPNEVVEEMLEIWINVSSYPQKLINCSAALFSNYKLREECKASNFVLNFDRTPG